MMTETKWANLSWHAREQHVARLRANVEQARRAHVAWKIAQGITPPEPEPALARLRKQDLVLEEVEHLAAFGESAESICERLGMSGAAITSALVRVDRLDLANMFRTLKRMQESHPCADCGEACSRRATRCLPCAKVARWAA